MSEQTRETGAKAPDERLEQIKAALAVEWRQKTEHGIHHDHLSDLAYLIATLEYWLARVRELEAENQHEKFKNQNLQATLTLYQDPDKVTLSKAYCDELYGQLGADDTDDVVDVARQLKERAEAAEAQVAALERKILELLDEQSQMVNNWSDLLDHKKALEREVAELKAPKDQP